MDEDKLKQLIAAALTFGALSIPGFSEWLHSVGGQAEVLILTGSLWKVIHLTVDWLHARGAAPAAKVSAVILALVLVPSFAWAQDAPAQPDRGGILATYSLLPDPSLNKADGTWALWGDVLDRARYAQAVQNAPDPAPAPDRGGILATYSLAHMAPSMGRIALEADVRIAGTPLLFLGHVSEDGAGVGPQVRHDVGSVTLFGHTLIGSFESRARNADA